LSAAGIGWDGRSDLCRFGEGVTVKMRRPRFRTVAVGCAALVVSVAAWFVVTGPDEVLAEDDDHYFSRPLWASDGWIYLLSTFDDSEAWPRLMKVRPGHKIVEVPIAVPGCDERGPAIDDVFHLPGEGTLGVLSSCDRSGEYVTALAYTLRTGAVAVLGRYRLGLNYYGWGPVSWRGNGVMYAADRPPYACGASPSIVEIDADKATRVRACSRLPVATSDDVLYFAAASCVPNAQAASGESLCRWDRSTGAWAQVATGFTAIDSFAVHASGRIVVSEGTNGRDGLWLLAPDQSMRRIADELLTDPAIAPDGRSLVAIRTSRTRLPWSGTLAATVIQPLP
jgi:hypothetical protein